MNKAYPTLDGLTTKQFAGTFSSRHHGNMSLTYGDTKNTPENRKNFLNMTGIDYRDIVCAEQVHGCNIMCVTAKDKGRGALSGDTAFPATDALITKDTNVPLAIFTADCLSIFVYCEKTPAIGLIHAGWRGTKENIAGKTIKNMQDRFGSEPSELHISFGPAIRKCCYKVGMEVAGYFPAEVSNRGGECYFDLVEANIKQLVTAGAPKAHIFDPSICTICRNSDFFSYRKEGPSCGRIMSVIMLK